MPLTVAQLVARLSADTSGFYKSMAVANATMIRTGSIASRVFAGAGIATAAFGFLSLKSAGNYQQSMNILEAVSGATTKQMKALDKEAIDLGNDFKLPNVSARGAAEAMTELSKGGLSVKDIMGAVRGTLQLGLAANIGFADSADIVARTLKAFELPGGNAVKVANLLAAGANKSTAEIGDLAMGMQNASAQFSLTGYSVDDLVVSLSMLVDRGLTGELAGTALKTMLIRLVTPTTKAAAIMKELGVDVADAHGKFRPLPVIIGQFQKGLAKLNPEQKQQALNAIFGTRANAAMAKLTQGGTKAWKEYTKAIVGTNAAQKMTEARTKGFNGACQALMSAVETLAIELGKGMLPAAEALVRGFANLIEAIPEKQIRAFFRVISSGVKWVKDLVDGSVLLQSILVGVGTALVAYKTYMLAAFVVTKLIRAATYAWFLVQVMLDAALNANPIMAIGLALIALGAALIYAYKHSETFRYVVHRALEYVELAWHKLMAVVDWVVAHWQLCLGILTGSLGIAIYEIYNHWASIQAWTVNAWNTVVRTVLSAVTQIRSFIHTYLGPLEAYVKGLWGIIKAVTLSTWNVIKAIVVNVVNVIRGKISAWSALKNIVGAIWAGVKSVTKASWDAIFGVVWASLTLTWKAISLAAVFVYQQALALGQKLVQGIIDGVVGLAKRLGSAIAGGVRGGISWAKNNIFSTVEESGSKHLGKPLADGIIRGFLLGIRELPTKVSDSIRNTLERAKTTIDSYQSVLQDAFSRLGDIAFSAFDAITSGHQTPAEKLLAQMESAQTKKRLQDAVNQASADLATATAGGDPTEIAQAQQAYDDAVLEQTKYDLQIQADEERKQYEARRAMQRTHFEDQLADLEAALAKHPEKHKYYQNKIIKLLKKYGISYKSTGKALGTAFSAGLAEAEGEIEKEIKKIAKIIARYLKLNSPAEEGPLSTLDKWWNPFAKVLTSGLDSGAIRNVLSGVAQGPMGTPGLISALGGASSSASASQPQVVKQYYVSGSLIRETELDQRIMQGYVRERNLGRGK